MMLPKLDWKALKEDARKIGMTIFLATILTVSIKPDAAVSKWVTIPMIVVGLSIWMFGIIINSEDNDDD